MERVGALRFATALKQALSVVVPTYKAHHPWDVRAFLWTLRGGHDVSRTAERQPAYCTRQSRSK